MEIPYTQIFLKFLALLCFYGIYRKYSAKRSKNKELNAPEPSGSLPLIGHLHLLIGSRQEPACRTLGAIADRCGPIFALRLGGNQILVVSGSEVVKDCLATNDRILATRASIAAGKHMGYNNAVLALAPYGQYWRDVRKLATLQLLSNHRIEMLKHIRLSETDALIKDLHNLCRSGGNVVEMSKLVTDLTFNISLRMIVGKRFCSEMYEDEKSEAWRYKKAIDEALYLSGAFVLSDAILGLEWMDFEGHIRAMKRVSKELDAVIGKWVEEHVNQGKRDGYDEHDEIDFMDVMLSNIAEGVEWSGHSRDVIVKATTLVRIFELETQPIPALDEILTLTGSGSTAVTVTWALSLLLNNPKVMKTAQEEVDRFAGREKWVQESDLQNLKYLQAIVKETLRLYPPGPLTGIREAMEDCHIGGYFVPKGTRLLVNIWKLHRDPRVWENPDEFQPERFLTKHADVDVRGQNFAYIPFSSGRRSCPAINLGLQIVHLILARLVQGFVLSTIGGCPVDMGEGMGIALPKVNPLQVVIKPRLASELYQELKVAE